MRKQSLIHFFVMILLLSLLSLACGFLGATPAPSQPTDNEATGGETTNPDFVVKEFNFPDKGITIQATGRMDTGKFFTISGLIKNSSGQAYDAIMGVTLFTKGQEIQTKTTLGEEDGTYPHGGIIPADLSNSFFYIRELKSSSLPDDFELTLTASPQSLKSCVFAVEDWKAQPTEEATLVINGTYKGTCQCTPVEMAPEVWVGNYLWKTGTWPVNIAADGRFKLELVENLDYPANSTVKNLIGICPLFEN